MGRYLDLTGQKYGLLTVKSRAPDVIVGKDNTPKIAWYCDCDCGTKNYIVTTDRLRVKKEPCRSCGCLSRETRFKPRRNTYKILDDYAVFYTNNGTEFYVDKDDIETLKEHTWYIDNSGYIKDRDGIVLHRLIMKAPKDKDVDHINHNKLDNRKCNLRIVTEYENMWNQTLAKNNSSGTTGVYQDKTGWRAVIGIYNKKIYLGHFKDKNDAIKARKNAEEKYYGRYSYDNSIKDCDFIGAV